MKIIRDGKIPNSIKFKCDKCGCVFTAGSGEFEFVDKYDKPINTNIANRVKCQCPCCLHEVFKNRKDDSKKHKDHKIRNTIYLISVSIFVFIVLMASIYNKNVGMCILSSTMMILSGVVAASYAINDSDI